VISRRGFVKAGAGLSLLGALDAAGLEGPAAFDRLDQGPFGIAQDDGWYTIATTTPAAGLVRNFGLGLMGYTWEENGPALAVREGRATLDEAVEGIARLPFVDVLYLRCDWRDVQSRPGRLDLHPVWAATRAAARRHGLRFGFRVQLSNPEIQPDRLALPDFLQPRIPLATLERRGGKAGPRRVEPRYDHPEFQHAFRELNALLAAELDADADVEFMDLMMYGFWGEGHTSDWRSPFPDAGLAERTFVEMTRLQMETWKRVPLVVNMQPDISEVGNAAVQDVAIRGGCWLRSDSVILDEPVQIDALANRPPWLAAVMEDGYFRQYRTDVPRFRVDAAGVDVIAHTMLHSLDVRANYWSLWTEAANLEAYRASHPGVFEAVRSRIGYRARPSWVWQRKRQGADALVVALANDGVAGIPGVLRLAAETADGRPLAGGALDAGRPEGGGTRLAALRMPAGLGGQSVRLRAEIETRGVRRPVRWACAQPLEADGAFVVKLKRHDEPDWRKGV
jgi:hypothetical protein